MEIELNLRSEPKETFRNTVIEAEIDNAETFVNWLARTKGVFIPPTDKAMYHRFLDQFKMDYFYDIMGTPTKDQEYRMRNR